MVSTTEYRLLYNDLYEQMRKYIWDIDVVYALAEVEIESYKTFPDINELRNKVDDLKYLISGYDLDDDDLMKALDAYEDYYDEQDKLFYEITRFEGVIQHEDHKG